jgi:AcrR family transcriptional regulator
MDAVAKAAGVSKQTVYSHFENKEDLFRACIRNKIASYGFGEGAVPPGAGAREALFLLARGFLQLLFDPEVMAMHRVVQAEAANFPRIASLFFESGPAAAKRAIGGFLQALVDRGELAVDDMDYASWLLPNMAVGSFRVRLELGQIDRVPEAELEAHLRRVVDDFLVLFGPRRGTAGRR